MYLISRTNTIFSKIFKVMQKSCFRHLAGGKTAFLDRFSDTWRTTAEHSNFFRLF